MSWRCPRKSWTCPGGPGPVLEVLNLSWSSSREETSKKKVCSLFSGCLGPRFDRKIDKHLPEYGFVGSPEAHPCRSSGDQDIANKRSVWKVPTHNLLLKVPTHNLLLKGAPFKRSCFQKETPKGACKEGPAKGAPSKKELL